MKSQNALKFRKGDLDHIVDDVEEDEEDEERGALARFDQEMREDQERTKAVITAITEGHDGTARNRKKGKYSFQKLVGGDEEMLVKNKSASQNNRDNEENEEEEELDVEEMLQRGMHDKLERERLRQASRAYHDASSSSEESDGVLELEENDLNDLLGNFYFNCLFSLFVLIIYFHYLFHYLF